MMMPACPKHARQNAADILTIVERFDTRDRQRSALVLLVAAVTEERRELHSSRKGLVTP